MGGQIIAVVNFNSLQTQNYLALRELHEQFSMGVQIIAVVNFYSLQTHRTISRYENSIDYQVFGLPGVILDFVVPSQTEREFAIFTDEEKFERFFLEI